MLFNSYSFIFLFLPVTFCGMFWLGKYSHRLAALWLALASLTFYAVWDARFVLLLLASIAFNYGAGYWIGLGRAANAPRRAKRILTAAIALDLGLLGYFKYTNFFIASANSMFGTHAGALEIILPLGISFFTFTQIAFLVDVYRGLAREYNFIHYLLFVTWFPHLIAGPVIHHKQMMPQFGRAETYRVNHEHVAVGLTVFILGLAKKVLIADSLADYATPVFAAAGSGHTLMLVEAWVGALAYSLQLYFDFSAYSDMAIGLSLMFNIRLPLNFNSPYKATNIIDFWRRWHITLSTFLRDYLYIPLGGNRHGSARRYANLMATMLLGGLWHGAGWTYIVWGGLHGLYLTANHGWREVRTRLGWAGASRLGTLLAGGLTFISVVAAWVFFRADTVATATSMLASMLGLHGVSLPQAWEAYYSAQGVLFNGIFPETNMSGKAIKTIGLALGLTWLFPNVREIMLAYKPSWDDVGATKARPVVARSIITLRWRANAVTPIFVAMLFIKTLNDMSKVSEFLYFQF